MIDHMKLSKIENCEKIKSPYIIQRQIIIVIEIGRVKHAQRTTSKLLP